MFGDPCGLGRFGIFIGNGFGDHIVLHTAGASNWPPLLFNKKTDWHGYALYSNCIAWVFEMSMDASEVPFFSSLYGGFGHGKILGIMLRKRCGSS